MKLLFRISIFSFALVALLGITMRYKIAFSLPYIDQKNLQHAHSHFAFAGWISMAIWTFIILLLANHIDKSLLKKLVKLLWLNWITAIGMLVSFLFYGYNPLSIAFSSSSIIINFSLIFTLWKPIKTFFQKEIYSWFIAAMFFNIISVLGTAALVIMMVSKHIPQKVYLASVYWYLHFSYNGWFWFATLGLLFAYLASKNITIPYQTAIFNLMKYSCLPAFGLSILWLKLPNWIYLVIVLATLAQSYGWYLFLKSIYLIKVWEKLNLSGTEKWILRFLIIAASTKFALQLGSVIPQVSKLAFGFRPVVIAYLHLIFLATISTFLIAYAWLNQMFNINKTSVFGVWMLLVTVLANELVLGVQGVAAFSYTLIPFTQEILLFISIGIFSSIILLLKNT